MVYMCDTSFRELFPSPKKSHKVQIRQIAAEVNWEEFEQLVKSHGGTDIFSFERGGTDEAPIATITLNTSEAAQKVVSELNGTDYGGSALRVFHLGEPRQKPHRRVNYRQNGAEPPRADFPLRMSVDARYVGAIIGQGGANIRAIAKESKARCV